MPETDLVRCRTFVSFAFAVLYDHNNLIDVHAVLSTYICIDTELKHEQVTNADGSVGYRTVRVPSTRFYE